MSIAFASPKHNENLKIRASKEIFRRNYISFLKFFLIIVLRRKKTRRQIFAAEYFYLESNFGSNYLKPPIILSADFRQYFKLFHSFEK